VEAKRIFASAFGQERADKQFPPVGEKFAALCVFEGDLSQIGLGGDGQHLLMYIQEGSVGGGPIATW
jgi:hypothetical protein